VIAVASTVALRAQRIDGPCAKARKIELDGLAVMVVFSESLASVGEFGQPEIVSFRP